MIDFVKVVFLQEDFRSDANAKTFLIFEGQFFERDFFPTWGPKFFYSLIGFKTFCGECPHAAPLQLRLSWK